MGTRSLPSAEIEFDGVQAHLIGHSGDGLQMIMSMINLGRFECVMAAAALMRVALVQAIHHTRHRHVLGKRLCDQPVMESVLADLALESEAATTLMLHIAQTFDDKNHALARLLTALAKFWICKRAPGQINEALECLGGNGYVEEALLARYYRDAPLNAIWEGPGNVAALDVVRCLKSDPYFGDTFMAQSRAVHGLDRTLDQAFDDIHFAISAIQSGSALPMQPRLLAERMTVAYQAAL
ncbi:putative acyl-CoA dehydrogenase, partial [Salinisphaera hydrothermalis C41B8]